MGSWLTRLPGWKKTAIHYAALALDAALQAGDLVEEFAEGAVHGHGANDALQGKLLGEQPGRVRHHLGSPGHGGQGCGCAALLLTLPQLVLAVDLALERGSCRPT